MIVCEITASAVRVRTMKLASEGTHVDHTRDGNQLEAARHSQVSIQQVSLGIC